MGTNMFNQTKKRMKMGSQMDRRQMNNQKDSQMNNQKDSQKSSQMGSKVIMLKKTRFLKRPSINWIFNEYLIFIN